MTIALDIGGTNIRIAEVSGTKIKNKIVVKNPREQKQTLRTIISLIEKYKTPKICIATAGFEQQGLIKGSPNTFLNNTPLKKILQQKFRTKIYIQNDARCAALAELKFGAGKKLSNFVLLTLGTGIGGAIVINKKLYLGRGSAGEIGQMFLGEKTFEELASGTAFQEIKSFEKIGKNLSLGLANLAFILSPETFIFGGGFSLNKEIFPIAESHFKKLYTFQKIPFTKAKFIEDGGLIGAALLTN